MFCLIAHKFFTEPFMKIHCTSFLELSVYILYCLTKTFITKNKLFALTSTVIVVEYFVQLLSVDSCIVKGHVFLAAFK